MTVYSKHHATHASKNAASSGKGILGSGPSGFNSTAVVVPPMSFHRKPSAALYGNTAPLKKSAGPVNVPHKPFAGGDGHPGRKVAVHAGIPQAKKLPASDKNITVRCTWTNNVASPIKRTVTNVSSHEQNTSAAVQVYRAPTPPPSAADIAFPSSCQDDVRRKLERMKLHAPQEALV